MTSPDVSFVFPGKLGGVTTIVANLLAHRTPDAFTYSAILTHNRLDQDARFYGTLAADREQRFSYHLPVENLYRALSRLARRLPNGPGVLVSNDWIELATETRHPSGRTVIQLLHGDHDYYYDMAVRHEPVIDAYVAYSRAMFENLCQRLPERRDSIFHLPYGVPLANRVRRAAAGPLRLVFAGRLENGQKGIFDLPEIDRHLTDLGIPVVWTIAGDGPHSGELARRWGLGGKAQTTDRVRWLGRLDPLELANVYAEADVFVLPTRAEGFPVALLEAMSAGLVPVVSDIASGVPEVVEDGVTGLRPAVGDIAGFASAIATLSQERDRLEAMSRAARQTVALRFDIRDRVSSYQALFARFRELRRPRTRSVPMPYGSRLDKPWLPNAVVIPARAAQRMLRGKRAF